MRASETIKAEIVERFGFFPPFFEPAMPNPAILENLWQQTLLAYVENPIPALFKEKVAALLARYCPVPYCLVCHASTLRPLGMKASDVLAFLDQPALSRSGIRKKMEAVLQSVQKPLEAWPAPESDAESVILYLALDIAQNSEEANPHQDDLKKLLCPRLCDYLILFLAYNKTCLVWAEAHPELSYEADKRVQENLGALLRQEPQLAEFFRDYRSRFQKNVQWRRQEASLRKTEKLFKLMVESVMDYAIILIDLDGIITEWNIGAERLLGYKEEETIGKTLEIFFTPEDRTAGVPIKELTTARATGHARDERYHLRKDGTRLWVKGFMTAVKSEDGTIQAYAKIMQDVTDRRKVEDELARWAEELEDRVKKRTVELAQSQDALHQAQKLEAVGQLAGGVAHDFNNLITGILGMSEVLRDSFAADDPRIEDVEEIIKASNRAFALTRQLLAFGRRQMIQPQVFLIQTVIGDMHKLLARLIGEDINVQLHLDEKSAIFFDPGQIEQILMNLVLNARDAMPQGGTVTIRTADVRLMDGDSDRHFNVPEGPYVMLEVSDTGHGMTKEVLKHIFEPFFTTKERDRGTGLGLATVYGIIKQGNGDIHVYSEPGIGTAFKVYFPVTAEQITPKEGGSDVTPSKGTEYILVVEDDDIVRKVVVKRLRAQGYTVCEASNGKDAIKLVQSDQNMLDLILTDVIMPEMTGKDVVEKIREIRPHVSAVYMSGYPEDIIAVRGILEPGINFIEKAHLATRLIPMVQKVIEQSRS